jgi:cytochrome oxidase Cu insertion factor (SCO1/SenC/PrrC family)
MTTAATHPSGRANRWLRRLRLLAFAATIPAAAFLGFALGAHRPAATPPLPVIRAAPPYVLTNQLGQSVSSDSLRGKVQIVSFLFPYCTTMCPLIAAHLANFENLGARPAGIADKVAIVAFNIDPSGTGLPQMRAFLKQYGWNPDDLRWQYLTGAPDAIRRVVRDGFDVAYEKVPDSAEAGGGSLPVVQPEVVNKLAETAHADYDIVHNDVIEIVDQQGRIRKIFDDTDTINWPRLLSVVQGLLGEEKQG